VTYRIPQELAAEAERERITLVDAASDPLVRRSGSRGSESLESEARLAFERLRPP